MKNDMYIEINEGKDVKSVKIASDSAIDFVTLGKVLKEDKDKIVLNSLCAATFVEVLTKLFGYDKDDADDHEDIGTDIKMRSILEDLQLEQHSYT